MGTNFLEISNLNYSFPKTKIKLFSNLNIKISNDLNILGLLGSNGSGKSVLAKIITGLAKPNSGSIYINTKDITDLKMSKRLKFVSMSFQMINMSFIRHSLKDEILYSQKLLSEINLDKEQIINEVKQLLELFKDNENQHPLSLSGGEKRKLIFNLLKLSDPEIYILDEPTVGLDYYAIQELKKEIISLKLRNKKVIIITHDLKFLLSITDEVLILQKDEHTGMSSICYQGSLSRYLIHNEEVAKLILTIPIEFTIYKNKLLSNEIPSQTMYFDFLQSQVT